jgi:hypothetical protein
MLSQWILSHNRPNARSYKNLKIFIGILGMALPVILVLGGLLYPGHTVQHSVSHYYHTDIRDVLVGTLASASILFMTYLGYGIIDDVLTWAVGIAGVCVILFPCPTSPEVPNAVVGVFRLTQEVSGPIHFSFAGAFFLLLAVNSIFLFTLSDQKKMADAKRARNIVYVVCGALILACLAVLLILSLAAQHFFENSSIALVFEAIMLLAFGFAWLVKSGIGLFPDAVVAATKGRSRKSRPAKGRR